MMTIVENVTVAERVDDALSGGSSVVYETVEAVLKGLDGSYISNEMQVCTFCSNRRSGAKVCLQHEKERVSSQHVRVVGKTVVMINGENEKGTINDCGILKENGVNISEIG